VVKKPGFCDKPGFWTTKPEFPLTPGPSPQGEGGFKRFLRLRKPTGSVPMQSPRAASRCKAHGLRPDAKPTGSVPWDASRGMSRLPILDDAATGEYARPHHAADFHPAETSTLWYQWADAHRSPNRITPRRPFQSPAVVSSRSNARTPPAAAESTTPAARKTTRNALVHRC